MQQSKTIARPYAQAIFEIAQQSSQLDLWAEVLLVLGCVAAEPEFHAVALSPRFSKASLIDFLVETVCALMSITPEQQQELSSMLNVIYDDKRLLIMTAIDEVYSQLLAAARKVKKVSVVSAFTLDEKQRKQIGVALEQRFASQIELSFSLDQSLIGGAVIRCGSWVMDGSVQGKLQNLIDSTRG
jgi:F-type H+-transporting ATPase subunit delta